LANLERIASQLDFDKPVHTASDQPQIGPNWLVNAAQPHEFRNSILEVTQLGQCLARAVLKSADALFPAVHRDTIALK